MMVNHAQELTSLFHAHSILDMAAIQKLVPDRSRSSLFRDLKNVEYLSSYNKAGRYYTLRTTPQYDDMGIWKYSGAYFSLHGTLKKTTKHLIDNSKAGHTHFEIQGFLGVRVHNTLLDLVTAHEIARELFDGTYVYTNTDPEIQSDQLDERTKRSQQRQSGHPLDPYITIEILRAVINHPESSATDIGNLLIRDGLNVKLEQVNDIFELYSLGKKNSQ